MSSVAHARVRTIDKDCLIKAAKDLGESVTSEKDVIKFRGGSYKFGSNNNVEVSYWDDVKSATGTAKRLAQLSTFYTMKERLEKQGLKVKNTTKDILLAVKANQKLVLEMEQDENAEVKA